MKKMAAIILGISMMANVAIADVLKLTTHGTVMSPVEILDRDGLFGAFLVEIQGMLYAVEDTPLWKVMSLRIKEGSRVTVGIWLGEDDRLAKMYIIE
jgi:hypothetical protein